MAGKRCDVSLRTYKFRLYPSKKQQALLFKNFQICKEVYNTLLEESKELQTTNKYIFNSLVRDIKITCKDYYSQVHSQVLQNVSDRLSKSFSHFFRRVKGQKSGMRVKAGYPRFKSKVRSITYPQKGFKSVECRKLFVSKIGLIPIKLHREIKGRIKTLTILVNSANQWHACFSCEVENKKQPHPSTEMLGIDVGVEHFATFSNGEHIANPKFLVNSHNKLKTEQRRLSLKKKGSSNRKKQRLKVARQHNRISNLRSDFLHKLSHRLAKSYSFIAVENLQIKNMLRNHHLARSISDASWGTFIDLLSYKVVTYGGQIEKVNPRGTSKTCSSCGKQIDMPLAKRQFNCPRCGLDLHRDVNSAIKILTDGRAGRARTYTPVDRTASAPLFFGEASGLEEAGTLRT
ncbi:MAG: transposase [Candidatus Woesearchaeota archaeon]